MYQLLAYVTMGNLGENLAFKTSPLSHPPMDFDAEAKLASDSSLAFRGSAEVTQKMKEMGLESKKLWFVYEFTKAMGELVIDENRGEIPVAIVRPLKALLESLFLDGYKETGTPFFCYQ
ncbi:hypothetical protein Pint_25710 [Pistacia integerrima]|uniref:Uncharacterized protein n=1 Tax=Pistacia integerrima TaxID=434235 RepID=A0ACC0YEE1_9ROSI|nr:hypothetical protein Pint_25710 [Pistacia integerrima]